MKRQQYRASDKHFKVGSGEALTKKRSGEDSRLEVFERIEIQFLLAKKKKIMKYNYS